MRINIFDPSNLELIGVLSNYESVQWSPKFNTPDGSFTINCSVDYIGLMQIERYVENTEEPDHIGVIKRVQTVSSNQRQSLQIQGIMLEKDIFYKRVIKAWIMYQDMHPITALENIIAISMTDPAEPDRKIATLGKIITPKESDLPDIEKTQYSSNYANLGDEVFTLIQNMNIGVKACINHTTNLIDVTFYKGNDHTLGSDNPVIFSPERGTVLETTYAKDSSQNFTDLVVIGEDNVILEAERDKDSTEPIVEKSLNLSSEVPYPTYSVEKPEEDGGRYYRYKKYTPPSGFITNRDVWEKYEVEKIETTETVYQTISVTDKKAYSVDQLLSNPEILSNGTLYDKAGMVLGSAVSTKQAIESFKKNASVGSDYKLLGVLPKSTRASISTRTVQKAPLPALKASTRASSKPSKTSKSVKSKPTKSSGSKGTTKQRSTLGVPLTDSETQFVSVFGKLEADDKLTLATSEKVLTSHQVTVVTYKTGEFLEYVYVNIGAYPTSASKIVEGSFSSGDVTYYENFVETKVSESKYKEALLKKAKEYLKTFVVSESVSIEPYKLSNTVYGKNYCLGDIVTARNKIYGFSTDLRLTGITEVWDSRGYSIDVSLGDNVPTLTNRIKLLSKGGI